MFISDRNINNNRLLNLKYKLSFQNVFNVIN